MRALGASRTSVVPGGALAGGWTRNPLWKTARAVPSLDLRFADNKTLGDSYGGGNPVTFTRASTGTFVGSDGLIKTAAVDAPRFDHSITSSTTNLLLRSEEFDNASWTKSNSSIGTNVVTAPNGSSTADKLIEDTANATHLVYAGSSALTAGQPYVISVYLKAAERTFASIGSVTSGVGTGINLSTGVLVDVNVVGWINATTRSVANIGNGWYRVTVTVPSATGVNSLYDSIRIFTNNGTTTSYTGDGTSGLYLWGAQLEQASTVSPYVPTTTAAATSNTTESLGLLVEEARTNAVTSSADFSTGWTPTRATLTTNQTTAPDGTTTADLLTEDTSTNTHIIQNSFSVTSGTSYTLSVWVKQNASVSPTRNIRLFLPGGQFGSGSAVAAGFDLATGVITVTNSPSATSLQFYANGWARVSVTSACTTTGTASISLQMTSGVSTSYTGGSSGLYLWGAQFEAGAFMTSYIPTTGTTATRAADVVSITGANFNWYNQTEGTVFADAKEYPFTSTLSRSFYGFDSSASPNADFNRQWIWNGNTTLLNNSVYTSSSGPTAAEFSSTITNEQKRTALTYKVNDYARSYNGGAVVTDLSGNLPVGIDRLGIGSSNNSQYLNGTIKRLTYWPTRLSDTALQSITAP